ncbi:MAG: hypothetical protein LBM69_00640, partial [Lachnospiraceae bacterium]|nr:hypothetical protein [Lachnospiraceae bacterium]
DDIAPINVTQSVVVAVVQKPISYTATLSHEAVTFSNAIIGYGTQNATEITITNTGTGQITGLNAALSTSDFEISTALSATTINAGATATLSVRPITGKTVNTYTDTLTITADHGISLTVSLSFTVNKASQTTLSLVDPGTLTYGDTGMQLAISGGSGDGDVIFSVPENEYLDVASDGSLTIKAASDGNSVTVSVYKEGNATYLPSNTATLSLVVERLAISVPSANTSLTYNGSSQTGVSTGTGYTVSGNSATNAGDYTATVTPDSNYQWDSGENVTAARNIVWSIGRLGIPVPSANTSLTYDGSSQTGVSTGTGYTVSGNSATNAGDYTATVTPGSNYQWDSGENVTAARNIVWSIGRLGIPVPTANTSLTYNGNSQIGVNAGTGYTIVGNSAINAGNHTATVTPDSNYQWDSGENVTAARSISWSIGRLGIAKPTLSTNALTYNGATQTILSDGTGYTVSGNTGEDADDYTVTVQLNSNYKWADNTTGNLELAWTIIRCPITVTAQDKSKYYGEKDPTLTYTVTPTLFAGDTLTGSLQYIGSNVGTYTIVQNVPFAHPNYTVTFVSGKMHILQIPTNEQVIDLVDQFPQNETTQFFADQVASASKMYDALSDVEKSQIPQSIKDALLAAQAKAAIVNHQDTEGWVIGDIPWNVRLSLDLIPNENVSKANFETELPTDKELVVLFEIKLINTMNRENYVIPQGESVTITLHVSLLDPTGAVILHQKHDGTIEVLEAVVTKDTVTFTASSFSLYGVAVEKDVPQNPPVQSDEPTVSVKPSEPIVVPTAPKTEMQDKQFLLGIGIGVISLLLLVAVVGILIRRRKDDEL